MSRFENHWARVVDDRYLTPDVYFDIGKELCPSQRSRGAKSADIIEHLLENGNGNRIKADSVSLTEMLL